MHLKPPETLKTRPQMRQATVSAKPESTRPECVSSPIQKNTTEPAQHVNH